MRKYRALAFGFWQIIDLLATEKSRYFAQPCPVSSIISENLLHYCHNIFMRPCYSLYADILRDSSGVPVCRAGTHGDQTLRTSARKAGPVRVKFQQVRMALKQ